MKTSQEEIREEDREDRRALLSGIREDAAREAERVLQQAQAAAAQRREAAGSQAESIRMQAEERIGKQTEALQRQAESALRMEEKRLQLRVRERIIAGVEQRARERLKSMVGQKGYREVLSDWIVEAAVGLNAPEATVNCSLAERDQLDEKLLREAEARVRKLTGAKVKLHLSDADPLVGQGIVLTSGDGRVEFNNQVTTRLLRAQSAVRKAIYEELFG